MSSTVAELGSAPLPWTGTLLATLKRAMTVAGQHVRRPGLVTRFTIIGATMALLIATTLAGLIEARLSEYIMDLTVERAIDQVELGLLGNVSPADFKAPYTQDRLDDLATRLDPHLSALHESRSGILRLHLFAPDGTVLYSDLAAKRGTVANVSAHIQSALDGQTVSGISSLGSEENRDLKARYDSAIEVYMPFVELGKDVGATEIYTDIAPIRPIRQLVWIAVVGGFMILFLSLFAV